MWVENILGAACPRPPESWSRAKNLCLLKVCRGGRSIWFSVEEAVASLLCCDAF